MPEDGRTDWFTGGARSRHPGAAAEGASEVGAGAKHGVRDGFGGSESTPRKRPLSAERLEALAALAGINRLELTIEKLVLGGDGLARWRGMPVFVPRAAPGDVQLGLKAAAARETLRRLGGIDPGQLAACRFEEPVGERPWGYRLRAQVHVVPRDIRPPEDGRSDCDAADAGTRQPGSEGPVGVGFRRRRSHDLVLVDRCPVLAPALEKELRGLSSLPGDPAASSKKLPSRLSLATAGLGPDSPVVAAPPVDGLPRGDVEMDLLGRKLSYDARCFFQAHGGLLESLLQSAVGPFEGDAAVELFAGVGFFTVGLADRYGSVTAVEGESVAARYARNNLRRNRLRHCRVERSAVESWVDRRNGGPGLEAGLDRVLVDPPRAGLSRKVRGALLSAAPRRLTYVSCDPATALASVGCAAVR